MKVLIGCETSGVVRDAFRRLGHDAWSCDLLPTETNDKRFHIIGDILDHLEGRGGSKWDLLIAHPECTYLCSSGLHWNGRGRGHEKTERALDFVRRLMGAPIERIAIENPTGRIGTAIRKADQIIQPYQFGIPPRYVNDAPRWSNQTDSGQNKLGPSEDRWKLRSKTYQGIGEAMAMQWSNIIEEEF